MSKVAVLLALGLVVASQLLAAATEKPYPTKLGDAISHASATCDVAGVKFSVDLGDELKEIDNERASLGYPMMWITSGDKRVAAIPSMEHNELLLLDPGSDSVCTGTRAFAMKDGSVAIFAQQSGRPFADRLAVSIYDPKAKKVLVSSRDIGPSDKVEMGTDGPVARIKNQPTDVAQFEVEVQGQKATTSEEVFDSWAMVKRRGGKIVLEADRELTWTRSPYHSYFKTREDFEKAFAWNAKTKTYDVYWVYRIKTPDCVGPTKERDVKHPKFKWYCV